MTQKRFFSDSVRHAEDDESYSVIRALKHSRMSGASAEYPQYVGFRFVTKT